jgi:outer membrane protein OmpA-like peptidoglycan-associated protein
MRTAAALLLVAAAALCGCAPIHPALFVVVPGSDGHVGKIVVNNCGARYVIDTAYGAQRLGPNGVLQAQKLTAAEVNEAFGTTLAALPPKPTSFTLYFLGGSDELTPESQAELQKVFDDLKSRPLPDVVVIGHTDTVGGFEYNDKLSLARAERLREMLAGMGIPADRIEAAGRGKRELLVATDDNVSEPRNRRVEINVR